MSILRRIFCYLFLGVLFSTAVPRLPAPIQEVPESPTPATQEPEAPKRKHSAKSKASSSDTEQDKTESRSDTARAKSHTTGSAKFAGTWSGRINQGFIGNLEIKFVIDGQASTVTDSSNYGGATHAATLNGSTLEWKAGLLREIAWTLTPNPDGQTALVTSKSALSGDATATFRRWNGAESKITAATSTQGAGAQAKTSPSGTSSSPQQSELPVAKPVPGKAGFVFNPYDPKSEAYLDVRGMASGAKVKILTSGKFFIVP
jgi:hypothetical protein